MQTMLIKATTLQHDLISQGQPMACEETRHKQDSHCTIEACVNEGIVQPTMCTSQLKCLCLNGISLSADSEIIHAITRLDRCY